MDAQFGGVDQRKIFTLAEKVASFTSFTHLFHKLQSFFLPHKADVLHLSFIFNTNFTLHSPYIMSPLRLLYSRDHIIDI